METLNRRTRKALAAKHDEYWRVTPLFTEPDGTVHAGDGVQTYVMHTDPKNLLVVRVPAGAISVEMAQQKEQELMTLTGKDVIVVGSNVQFLKTQLLTRAEVAAVFPKGVPNAAPKA